ncbi:MAG: hypothetical protein PHV43_03200 [Candidatus Colwellbacteria bacterium]|nr:hypothetical protein [Candidatus Colwellbacteria bacterium]
MSRGAKHVLYGLLFLLILGLMAAAVYLLFFRALPNCEDNILNQNEEDVDCGGVCVISCEEKNFRLIKSDVGVVSAGEAKLTLAATITNNSPNYGARGVEYSLDIRDLVGGRLDLVEGETIVPPETTRYIVESGFPINPLDIGSIEFDLESDFMIVPKGSFTEHSFTIKQAKPTLSENAMRIDGIMTNNTEHSVEDLKLGALIRNKEGGQLIGAATTILDQLAAFKSRGFTIFVSVPSNVVLDDLKTEIFWETAS